MQDTVVDEEVERLDLSKVPAIQQKRTLAFVNHFVLTTVQFLNNFTKNCENKLMLFERKLEKVEAALVLLETKLSSIPELNGFPSKSEIKVEAEESKPPVEPEESRPPVEAEPNHSNISKEEENNLEIPQISLEYERFVKMVQVGVPLNAVKLKLSMEGLDPNILESALKR